MSDFERKIGSIQVQKDEELLKLIPDSLPDEIKQALKSCAENLSKQEAEQEKFEEYIYKINSDDIVIQYSGLNRCKKLLSAVEIAAPPEQMIEMLLQTRVHLRILDIAKNTNVPLLRYEALWIICNIGFGTQKQIQTMLDHDGVNILFQALQSEYDEIIELGVWALSNIAGDNIKFRDMLLSKGILEPFIHIAKKCMDKQFDANKFEILKTLVWGFSNLSRGKSTPNKMLSKEIIQILCQVLLGTEVDEILIDACWSLSFLSQDENLIDVLIEERVTQKLITLLQRENKNMKVPVLRILGNLLTGNEEQTNEVLKFGIIPEYEKLLFDKNKGIRKEVCWSLSNIAAGSSIQVKQIIRHDSLLNSIFLLLTNGTDDIIEQITYILSNSVVSAELKDIDHLVMQHGFFQKMSMLLDKKDKLIIRVSLEGIYEIIKRVQYDERLEQYKQMIVDSKIMEKVEQKLKHNSKDISQNAKNVFEIFNSQNNP